MSSHRRRGYGAVAVLLIGAAALTALVVQTGRQPVDIRQVAPRPSPEQLLSATLTTTMLAVDSAMTTTTAPPAIAAPRATGTPPLATTVTPTPTTTSRRNGLLGGCEYNYQANDGRLTCLPWPLDLHDVCQWLGSHGVSRLEIRTRDGEILRTC